jgi:hypothetical protein
MGKEFATFFLKRGCCFRSLRAFHHSKELNKADLQASGASTVREEVNTANERSQARVKWIRKWSEQITKFEHKYHEGASRFSKLQPSSAMTHDPRGIGTSILHSIFSNHSLDLAETKDSEDVNPSRICKINRNRIHQEMSGNTVTWQRSTKRTKWKKITIYNKDHCRTNRDGYSCY